MKKNYQLTKLSGTGKQYIRVSETQWKHGFKVSEKVGMLEIEPGNEEANNEKLAALESGAIQAQLGNVQNRNTGFYDVTIAFAGETAAAPTASETVETTA